MDLFQYVESRNHAGLKHRLDRKKTGLETLNEDGKSALCVATEMNNLPGMGLLIEAKANVNFVTLEHTTLLDLALSKSFSTAGQMLYDNGGRMNIRTLK